MIYRPHLSIEATFLLQIKPLSPWSSCSILYISILNFVAQGLGIDTD